MACERAVAGNLVGVFRVVAVRPGCTFVWLEDRVDFSHWVNTPLYPFKVPLFSLPFLEATTIMNLMFISSVCFYAFTTNWCIYTQHRELLSFIHIEYMYYYSFLFFSSPLNIVFWEISMMNHIDAPGNSVVYFTVIYLLYLYPTVFIFLQGTFSFSPKRSLLWMYFSELSYTSLLVHLDEHPSRLCT